MFDRILNSNLSNNFLELVCVGLRRSSSPLVNLGLPLPPISFDWQQTQGQQDEILDWLHVLISLNENSSTGWIRLKRVNNSRPVSHKSSMMRCSLRAAGIQLKHTTPNYKNSKIRPSLLHHWSLTKSWSTYVCSALAGSRTLTSAVELCRANH